MAERTSRLDVTPPHGDKLKGKLKAGTKKKTTRSVPPPDGGRSTPTGKADVDQGKERTPGAEPKPVRSTVKRGRSAPPRRRG